MEKAKKGLRNTTVTTPYNGAFPWRCPTPTLESHVTFQIQNSVALAPRMCTFICLLAAQLSCQALPLM